MGRKKDPGNYQPVNLASVSVKTIEENLEALFRHVGKRECAGFALIDFW